MSLRGLVAAAGVAVLMSMPAAALETLHSSCSITAGEKWGTLQLRVGDEDCQSGEHCGNNFSSDGLAGRFTGFTPADLSRDGAQVTAVMSAEAGTFTCAGTVHDGALEGKSTFTPDQKFVDRMRQLGFTGFNSEKLQAYTFFDIKSAWVESLKAAKVSGMTVDNIIALKIFRAEPAYVSQLTSMGYQTPDADKLIALKVQGVDMNEVKELRQMGYQPSLDELIQIRIFKVTPEFIRQMRDRGFKDLTIAKLVQIKIFKLDE
ncbi:hypothetical protein [Occallatibacter riparius]|uniref:Uncharacterized protein n=1 Tax=Occallatibacter riparius TaxID=1002689 RepID=A0A9J7BMF0_9BACT|nr:hypothetical protein [Occallatibacter riparius]UWZ83912.1 hypothetical protein MOP44_25560 [Occallatibacter riparius]